jgi:hypothetical protein
LHCRTERGFDRDRAARAFLIGVAIAYAIPAILSWGGVNEQLAFAAVIVVFSVHHFLLEAISAAVGAFTLIRLR